MPGVIALTGTRALDGRIIICVEVAYKRRDCVVRAQNSEGLLEESRVPGARTRRKAKHKYSVVLESLLTVASQQVILPENARRYGALGRQLGQYPMVGTSSMTRRAPSRNPPRPAPHSLAQQ